MKELSDIIAAYEAAVVLKKRTALATVVKVEGSAYRREGARMLITEDGELTGAISGGCLEGDALRKARLVILQQEAMLVTYDTTDDDDAKLGVGLGCNGIIHILIEPINEGITDNPITLLKGVINNKGYGVLATVFSITNKKAPQPGTCLSMTNERTNIGRSMLADLQSCIISDGKQVLESHKSIVKEYNQDITYTVFTELLSPVISLIIVGAGNDAIPLVRMADILGWEITVVDGRANYATQERFTPARIIVAKPEEIRSRVNIHEWTAIVMMTHNYNYEIALLKELAGYSFKYVGILGPKKKLDRMLSELKQDGISFSEKQHNSIYGPIGLDIGSEAPEEIALSIVAEIKAVFSGRQGYSLKSKISSIHEPEIKHINN